MTTDHIDVYSAQMPQRGFVDESMRRRPDDDSVYVLAAVLVHDEDADHCRDVLRRLRYGRSAILHWREEREDRRAAITTALANLPFSAVVAVCLHTPAMPQERAWRLCFERLYDEMVSRKVSQVCVETRHAAQDRRDRALLTGLRKAGRVPHELVVGWEPPTREAMLWAADRVAGAVTQWTGDQPAHFEALRHRLDLVEVTAR